jgi:putative FmdB family regulatory protein
VLAPAAGWKADGRRGNLPPEGELMPTYDYQCQKCRKSFSQTLTIAQHDTKRITCPKCGSRSVKQKVTGFFAVTKKKS